MLLEDSLPLVATGGSLTFKHRNLAGKGCTAPVSATTQKFLLPYTVLQIALL
jgi:hypothetical protein